MKNIVHEQVTGKQLRAKRAAAGIAGYIVARRIDVSRGWLSEVECEVRAASQEDLARIDAALDEIIAARERLAAMADKEGLAALAGVRL